MNITESSQLGTPSLMMTSSRITMEELKSQIIGPNRIPVDHSIEAAPFDLSESLDNHNTTH